MHEVIKRREEIMPCYLTEKEGKKKILCLLQELFLRFFELTHYKKN